jgi:propanol-preferring alcohol dehydrogenase
VAAVGEAVTEYREGDRVALFPSAYCGDCEFCRAGRHSLCENSQVYGMARDGALADYVTAPARSVIPVPDAVPFDIAAIITDGVSTPLHALRSRGKLIEGESVAIVGCGGLGSHAVMLAREMGAATIVAVDTQPAARERALGLGADLALDPLDEDAIKTMRRHLGRSGVDLALEFVGRAKTAELAIRLLGKCGRAVLVGVGMERPSLPPMIAFAGREQTVMGSFGMDRADIEDLLAMAATGKLDLSRSVSARYALAEANEALQHLARKDTGTVRVVVEPGE